MAELDDEPEPVPLLGIGFIESLEADDDLDEEDLEVEQAIARAKRAGGLELERGLGFRPFYWRRV